MTSELVVKKMLVYINFFSPVVHGRGSVVRNHGSLTAEVSRCTVTGTCKGTRNVSGDRNGPCIRSKTSNRRVRRWSKGRVRDDNS